MKKRLTPPYTQANVKPITCQVDFKAIENFHAKLTTRVRKQFIFPLAGIIFANKCSVFSWLKIIAAFLDFYCSGNVGERTKFLPREGAIGGQNKGEERGGDIRNHRATIDEEK